MTSTIARIVVAALLAVAPAVNALAAQEPAPKGASAQAPVNLNQATAAELETLPGIGPRAAQRIVEFRAKNGGFKKVEDLMKIQGIGERSFLRLRPLVTVGSPKGDPKSPQ